MYILQLIGFCDHSGVRNTMLLDTAIISPCHIGVFYTCTLFVPQEGSACYSKDIYLVLTNLMPFKKETCTCHSECYNTITPPCMP